MLAGEMTDSWALMCPFNCCASSDVLGEPLSVLGGDVGGNLKSRFIELVRLCASPERGGGEVDVDS